MLETSEPANGVGQPCRDHGGRQVRMWHMEGLVGGGGCAPLWCLTIKSNNLPLDGRELHGFAHGEGVLE